MCQVFKSCAAAEHWARKQAVVRRWSVLSALLCGSHGDKKRELPPQKVPHTPNTCKARETGAMQKQS